MHKLFTIIFSQSPAMGKHWLQTHGPVLAMVALQFIYAGTALFAKAVFMEGVSPMVFIVYRQAAASLALAPATILANRKGGGRMALGIRGFCLVFMASFIGVTLNQFVYYQGLKLASASMASAVSNIVPAITFLIAASVGLEQVDLRSPRTMAKIFGTAVCVGGAIFMSLFKGQRLAAQRSETLMVSALHAIGEDWKIGCLFILGSSGCWSIWLILQVPISKKYLDPLSMATWMCFLSTLQSAAFTFFLEPDLKAWRLNSTFEILCCLYSGVIGSGVTFYLQSWCISRRGPLFSAMFMPLCTVIVTVLAVLLLDEHLYFGSMVGAIAVVVGLYTVLWGKAGDLEDGGAKKPVTSGERSLESDIKEPLLDSKLKEVAEQV